MIAATIPDGCRALDKSTDLPGAVRIEIGFYAQSDISEGAGYLVEFVSRHTAMADRP
jgi:hypothetical protein